MGRDKKGDYYSLSPRFTLTGSSVSYGVRERRPSASALSTSSFINPSTSITNRVPNVRPQSARLPADRSSVKKEQPVSISIRRKNAESTREAVSQPPAADALGNVSPDDVTDAVLSLLNMDNLKSSELVRSKLSAFLDTAREESMNASNEHIGAEERRHAQPQQPVPDEEHLALHDEDAMDIEPDAFLYKASHSMYSDSNALRTSDLAASKVSTAVENGRGSSPWFLRKYHTARKAGKPSGHSGDFRASHSLRTVSRSHAGTSTAPAISKTTTHASVGTSPLSASRAVEIDVGDTYSSDSEDEARPQIEDSDEEDRQRNRQRRSGPWTPVEQSVFRDYDNVRTMISEQPHAAPAESVESDESDEEVVVDDETGEQSDGSASPRENADDHVADYHNDRLRPRREMGFAIQSCRNFRDLLKKQEHDLIAARRKRESEKMRGPVPNWYTLRSSRFLEEWERFKRTQEPEWRSTREYMRKLDAPVDTIVHSDDDDDSDA